MPLYLLLIHAKARRENRRQDEKRRAQTLTTSLKQAHRGRQNNEQVRIGTY
jgi:hypothetical protein